MCAMTSVTLRDGRRMTYVAAGRGDGFPVLYLHGAIGSPRWRTPMLDELIERLGMRYVVVNRPGFAGSDPAPGRTVADFAADVEDVADALRFGRFSVVGVSAGAPYALACAWALPYRLCAAAAASPVIPASGAGASAGLRYTLPRMAYAAPRIGPLAASAQLRLLGLQGTTAPRAMVEDFEVCRKPWGFDPSEVVMPVSLWHGARDRIVPLAHALRLAAALPDCDANVEPGAGHFFYAQRLDAIVSPLAA